MNKKTMTILAVAVAMIAAGLLIYPHITLETEDKLIACRYSDDISGFETEVSPDENYTYWAERDVTWTGFNFRKFGPFYVLVFDIEKGNLLDEMYALDPSYIEDFLNHAVILENRGGVDLDSLIAGKEIKSDFRITNWNHDFVAKREIYYTLHGESNIMYIYRDDDLLVIQVGYPDEGPKYIAYE